MKQSTTFAICTIVSAIWCMTTVYAIGIKHLSVDSWIEYIFHAIPFLSFILCIILHNIEIKKEQRIKDYIDLRKKKRNERTSL